MAGELRGRRDGATPQNGREADEVRLRDQGRRGERRGRRGHVEARGDGALRDRERVAAQELVPPVPRGGGAEALRPRPKGRPRGPGPKAAPRTREQELEERVRRLEAQVAYLKKSIAPKAERRSRAGRGPWRSPSFQGRATTSPTCWRPPGWPGRRTATRSRTRRRRPGRSCAPGSRRSSAGSPTASATGRWRWGCAPSTAPA